MNDERDDPLRRIVEGRRRAREESGERYARDSMLQLRKNVETKIRTTMIGSLSVVEQTLGGLWGQDKPERDLTPDEREMRRVKDEMRTEILNLGNGQIRAAAEEISHYDVKWTRYHYDFEIREPGGDPPDVGGGRDEGRIYKRKVRDGDE